jgi:predicted dithiol-disulfide oxidoreductase (DUF899 family)
MKEIVKFGLVIGVLLCSAIGAASAQDQEFSEEYKAGFYDAAINVGTVTMEYGRLMQLYIDLGGESAEVTAENEDIIEYYNNWTTQFNEQLVPNFNDFIDQTFGPEDNRTEDLYLGEMPLIA